MWSSPERELVFECRLPVTAGEAFAWHERAGAFLRLLPPWERVRVVRSDGRLEDGARVLLETRQLGIPLRWHLEHRGYRRGEVFEDHQLQGPFASYRHEHRFTPVPGGDCILCDRLVYSLPGGAIADRWVRPWIEGRFRQAFALRHRRTRADLSFLATRASSRSMRLAVTGSSGLIGSALLPLLETQGHQVTRLVRLQGRAAASGNTALWDPETGAVGSGALENCDAVIHLAGAGIADARWSASVKRELVASRVGPTRRLAETISRMKQRPSTWIVASGIGFYGDSGDAEQDESSAQGRGFLAELCRDWEAATQPARDAGVRVVHLRTGIVLSPQGGALARLLPVFRAGTGGPVGHGRQWMSWISIEDHIRLILHSLMEPELQGAVNAVAPEPVRNAEFVETLGKVLRRPAVVPAPAFALRLLFGEMADALLLSGARVLPRAALSSGFAFQYPSLEPALRTLLGLQSDA